MKVKYTAISPIRQTRRGYVRDVVLELGDEKVYVVLFSETPSVFYEEEGVVELSLSRMLRGKLVAIRQSTSAGLVDEVIKKTL